MRNSFAHDLLCGIAAGTLATLPMSATMLVLRWTLPWQERRALPPRQITMEAVDASGVSRTLDEPARTSATIAAHFGYGAAMGGVYGGLTRRPTAAPVVKGIGFGLAVWTGSYLGLLPLCGSRAAGQHQGARRNALMIASHIVWGATLGWLAGRCRGEGRHDVQARLRLTRTDYHTGSHVQAES